ncbi:MAG: sulfotransferase [Gammaproteobacteria bacterium]|nr:sulfotransferase [Gammaproteobacteria bacterium]MBP6050913.1 sulfotransferase [Pseudomonadales bacterium]MBK6582420.1 sulfotransferase [Gammaproteobacteria bacterium]MBK7169566.1 sulfotransferase [Gammaproteobacteria bacterium]MBK7521309.1 sulfotransferase [Gammaproteobacteria bacterium]
MSQTRFAARLAEFHQQAIDSCGWDDFGGNEYRVALEQYTRSLDQGARLSVQGETMLAQGIVGHLRGRLYSEHYKRLHPEYAAQQITRPLFIVGLPRSGTSALHRILTADPQHQGLEYWLGQTPMPRPGRNLWPSLPEFTECRAGLAQYAGLAPQLMAIHEMAADEADECRLLLLQSFANVTLQSNARVPEYEEWLYGADFAPVYRRYRDNLRLIGLGNEARWILKDPSHLWAPRALLQTFPDACIVQTHRHPRELIPSVSSLVYNARRMFEPALEKHEVGRQQLRQWARVLNNLAALRRDNPQLQVHDLRMEDLQRDPMGCIEGIYRRFAMPFDRHSRQAVRHWTEQRPAARNPTHRYSAEEFGLDDATIGHAFEDYISTFLPGR